MKKLIIVLIIVILAVTIVWRYGLIRAYAFAAQNWIAKNSPTYKFDGFNLVLKDSKALKCFPCYEFTFGFQSRHEGYGDRPKGEVALREITLPHTIVIAIKQFTVQSAVTDRIYNEIKKEFLRPSEQELKALKAGKTQPLAVEPAAVYCVQQNGTLEFRSRSDGSQYGVCIFADKSECDEWAFFNKGCEPGQNFKK